eukprot:7050008-Pyramimonas_sp.AAC.1
MQRKRCAGRARQRMPPGQARAAAPPCEPQSRAGRVPADTGSHGRPLLAQEDIEQTAHRRLLRTRPGHHRETAVDRKSK